MSRQIRFRPASTRWVLAIVFSAGLSWLAEAHVVYGTNTLQLSTFRSDLIVLARVTDPGSMLDIDDRGTREPVVTASILAVLKGRHESGSIRFVQHGHGVSSYDEGVEVLLFLNLIDHNPELRNTPLSKHIDWVSQQEISESYVFDSITQDDFLAAVRSYAAIETLPIEERRVAMHDVTLQLLASPHGRLAESALLDLVLAADDSMLSDADLPVLEDLIDDGHTPIGVRIGLLVELERRALLDTAPRWAALLRETDGSDRLSVVRAARMHPSAEMTAELTKLLEQDDIQMVSAVAIALGAPDNNAAIPQLARLLDSEEQRVRMAAIRGLGQIGSTVARATLENTATNHEDPATRRRAAAEVELLDTSSRRSLNATEKGEERHPENGDSAMSGTGR